MRFEERIESNQWNVLINRFCIFVCMIVIFLATYQGCKNTERIDRVELEQLR